jgi:hypothetical protein
MIAVCSCGDKTANKMGEVICLNPHDAAEYVNLSEIVDSIICIKLQPAPDDIMGTITDVIIKKKYIYALDWSQRMLFIFDKTGKFVSKLSKKGEGPGEYRIIQSVLMDDNEEYVEVIDIHSGRRLKYAIPDGIHAFWTSPTCDDKNPALQAVVDGGTSSASCASLACGYENQALRANYTDANHFQSSINRSPSGCGRECDCGDICE